MGVKKPIFFCRLIGPVSWARWALPWSPAGPQPLGAGCPSVWQASQTGRAYGGTAWSHTEEHPWHHQSWVPPSTPETAKSRMGQWVWWDNIFVIFYLFHLEFIPLSDHLSSTYLTKAHWGRLEPFSSWHWADPGQVASSLQDRHLETNNHSHSHLWAI